MRALSAIVLAVSISGCATPQMAWLRIDGMRAKGDRDRSRQFETDTNAGLSDIERSAAPGSAPGADADKTSTVSEPCRACMSGKGYVLVREDEADAKAAELRAAA